METLYTYVTKQLQASKGKWTAIASDTGISVRTIQKWGRGEITNPQLHNFEKLAAYFRSREGYRK